MSGDRKPLDAKFLTERLDVNFALQAAGLGVWELDPATNLAYLDSRCQQLAGLTTGDPLPYAQVIDRIHAEDRPLVYQAVQQATNPQLGGGFTVTYRTIGVDNNELCWVRVTGKSYFNELGAVYRVAGVAQDITQQVKEHPQQPQAAPPVEQAPEFIAIADQKDSAQQQLKESEARLRSLIESAPFPIGVYTGPEMRIQFANQSIMDAWGKGDQVIGRPYAEVLPELANQGIYEQLTGVYQTGIAFHAQNQRVDLVIDGKLQPYYFKYSFTPLFTEEGQVYGVMNTAADVTDLVVAQQKLEEVQESLRGAIELAQLAAWSMDIDTGLFHYSDRFMHWLGFTEATADIDEAYNPLPDEHRQPVAEAIAAAIKPGSTGVYENEHPIINRRTGQMRIIQAQAQLLTDAQGKPYKLAGSAQDVTMQRELQQALEQQVRERTLELGLANEELAITNEELAATMEELAATNEELEANNEEIATSNEQYITLNEELQAANELLSRSNENLQRFAYVASHDLQEPLRKIQQFGDLLKSDYPVALGEGLDYVARMQLAASRMSTLIKDLLSFSQLTNRQEVWQPVLLSQVVAGVLTDLELVVEETGAQLTVDPLPTVVGDPSQLRQLFQNLLSNALKFQRPGVCPVVRVTAQLVMPAELPSGVKLIRSAQIYHQIDVSDNGIGFDESHVARIFEVFQRLHRKHEYAGTGIGLSICERVVTNHGGALTATSQVGQGSVFSVYLPV